jgi:hypothetical protein
VTSAPLIARIEEILSIALADDVLAWELGLDGWHKVPTVNGLDSQTRLEELAEERARSER